MTEGHVYHGDLPGFDARQIWVDGCPECEDRGERPDRGLAFLDPEHLEVAVRRALDWNRGVDVGRVSDAEQHLLELLWAVHVSFSRLGPTLVTADRVILYRLLVDREATEEDDEFPALLARVTGSPVIRLPPGEDVTALDEAGLRTIGLVRTAPLLEILEGDPPPTNAELREYLAGARGTEER